MSVTQALRETSDVAPDEASLRGTYGLPRLVLYAVASAAAAILVAGFWNYHVVDGFGREVVAGSIIGDTADLARSYPERGTGFGFLFAVVAGLAATFTACNCVVFAMIPGLACPVSAERVSSPWRALGAFVVGVTVICAVYGAFVGLLGSEGIETYNERSVRLTQAQAVFTLLGTIMLGWGLLELGLLDAVKRRIPSSVRLLSASTTVKAAVLGMLVGLFSVGRPFPVFREFLTYAAGANSPIYAAGVMVIQGVGQILVMVVLFAVMVLVGGRRLLQWAVRAPHQPRLISGLALVAGGAFFIFYWGLAFLFDIGRWGFKLGWYV